LSLGTFSHVLNHRMLRRDPTTSRNSIAFSSFPPVHPGIPTSITSAPRPE
jgi:hypothetical protein